MNNVEQNIRNHFKTFTVEDIANSVYFYGIDFDTVPMETLMKNLDGLYHEVKTLNGMIERDFKPLNGELLPKDPAIQSGIIQDYYRKESALLKALSNDDVYSMFSEYKRNENKGPSFNR